MNETLPSDAASESIFAGYDLLRERCGRLRLDDLSVIEFRGEDAKGWLQGQVTNDFRNLRPGGALNFCFCSSTGQIEAICTLWAAPDRYVVITDATTAPAILERCEKYVVLEDVRATLFEGFLYSIQGPDATRALSEFSELPNLDSADITLKGDAVTVLRSNRTGFGGWDVLVPRAASKAIGLLEDCFETVDEEAYRIATLEAGVPRVGLDVDAKTMPPELGPTFDASYVNYRKGCYMGQEILMRIYSRGHTNRKWVGLLSDLPLEIGARVSHRSRPDAGVVTRCAESPEFGFIGAAMVRSEAAFDGEVVSIETSAGTVEAEIREMPLLRFN